jgi:hypothetical protein
MGPLKILSLSFSNFAIYAATYSGINGIQQQSTMRDNIFAWERFRDSSLSKKAHCSYNGGRA